MTDMTVDEFVAKLDAVMNNIVPAAANGMRLAVLNIEGEAKRYCTLGQGPYASMYFPSKGEGASGSPYSLDTEDRRSLVHMRDTITSIVEVDNDSVTGIIGTDAE